MEKVVCIISLMFLIQNVYSQFNNDECVTPDSLSGICINIKNCPKLKSMLDQRGNATVLAFIRKSKCGQDGKDPKVCCRLNDTPDGQSLTNKIENTGTTGIYSKLPPQNECGRSNYTHMRILVEIPTELGDWPWMTALGYRNGSNLSSSYQWLCGGALLSDRYVITAAHCTVSLGALNLAVARFGDLDLDPNVEDEADPVDIPISHIITHEGYSATTYVNDIALLKLETSVRFNDFIKPICLPINSDLRTNKFTNKVPFVCGWGATLFKGPRSTRLMKDQLPVVDNEVCKNAYGNISSRAVLDDRILCAGFLKVGKDSCQGDSGGPLMFPKNKQYYLIGIMSYGHNCAEKEFPGIYTRTTSFLDWIVQNINNS